MKMSHNKTVWVNLWFSLLLGGASGFTGRLFPRPFEPGVQAPDPFHRHIVTSRTPTKLAAKRKTSTSISGARQNRVSSLLDWATQQADIQVSTSAVELTSTESAGLGFVAKQDIASGSVLLQVPETAALTIEAPRGGPNDNGKLDRACRDAGFRLTDLPWFVQFSLYLHTLKSQTTSGEGLNRKPWLDSLPTSLDTPIHWSSAQRSEWLQYDAMVRSVARQDAQWKSHHNTVTQAGGALASISPKDFVWGCEMARSRAFSGTTAGRFNPGIYVFTLLLVAAYVGLGLGTLEQAANGAGVVFSATVLKDFVLPKFFKKKVYVICPVIDMANHNSVRFGAQVSLEYFANSYSLATTKNMQAGDAIEISYGSRSNDQLLQYYGFVEPDNPSDVYIMPPLREWPLEAMEQATGRQVAAGRLEKLDRAGLLGKDTSSDPSSSNEDNANSDEEGVSNPWGGVVVNKVEGVDPAVVQALRALMSTEQEWQAAGEAVGNFADKVSPENERAALLAAKAALELELKSKPTTLDEDLDQLKQNEQGLDQVTDAEEALAIRFRVEKKKLLQQAIGNIRV